MPKCPSPPKIKHSKVNKSFIKKLLKLNVYLSVYWNIDSNFFSWSTVLFSFKKCLPPGNFQLINLHRGSWKLPVQLRGPVSCGKSFLNLQLEWFIFSLRLKGTINSKLNETLVKLRQMFFISLQKLFCSRENQIWDFQISWRHQMPKHKTRNTFTK